MDFKDTANLTEFIEDLAEDAREARKCLDANDSRYTRQAFVRALFGGIEGLTRFLKGVCLSHRGGTTYTDAELAMLKEESYEVNDKGEAFTKPKFIPIKDILGAVRIGTCQSWPRRV